MSFRLKTIIGVALIEGVLLLFLVWSSLDFLTRSSQDELAIRADTTSRLLAAMTKDAVLSTDLATLDEAVNELLRLPEVGYVRIKRAGEVLAQGGSSDLLTRPFQQDRSLTAVGDGIFDAHADITEDGEVYGSVELGLDVGRFAALLSGAGGRLRNIALMEMVLVALFSYVLGTYLTRGLKRLGRGARAISEGRLGTQVEVTGSDELAEASQAFNAMSRQLAESDRAVQRSMDESRRLSAQLTRRESHLRTILDTAVDGFVTIDASGVIEDINSAGARMFGYRRDELLGRNVAVLMADADHATHDGHLSRYLEGGVASIIGVGREVVGRRKDGSAFPLDLAVSEMRLDGGRMFVGLVRDISERKRTEAAARRSASLMTALVEANLDALVTTDIDGRIVEWSPVAEHMFGYSRDEAIGRIMASLIIPPALRAMHREGMARYRLDRTGPVLGNRIEVEALRRNGEIFPVELTVQDIELDGEILFTAFIRDITTRKVAEAELTEAKRHAESASEAKSRFLAHMSHEIRSPLNAMLGSMQLLLDEPLSREQRLYAKTAQTSGNTLLSLINDILDFSRIEAGELRLSQQPFDLSDLLSDIADLVALRARDKQVQTAIAMAPGIAPHLLGDALRLRQILINLMDNALKFTEQGAVALLVEQVGEQAGVVQLRFTVEDSGIGIPLDAQAQLFDEFRQVDSSDSSRHGGTGLGLSICDGLCRAMGGSITLDSVPGQGSRFVVEIPLTRQDASIATVPVTGERRVFNNRVLLVGLHPLVRNALRLHCATADRCADMVDGLAAASGALCEGRRILLVDGTLPAEELAELARISQLQGVRHRVLISPLQDEQATAWVRSGQYDDLLVMPLMVTRLIDLLRSGPQQDDGELDADHETAVSPPDRSSRNGVRLLLAEDSPANQMVARAMLEKAGYQLDIAADGQQAVAAFAAGDYALVLMDLRMPEMDGLAATAAIRATDKGRKVPIVALTANALQEEEQRCLAAGMNDYLTKPVERGRLLQTIAHWLGQATDTEAATATGPATADTDLEPLFDDATVQALARDTSDEVLPQMLSLFATEIRQRVDRISSGLHSLPLDQLEDESHTVKSCAGTFGALRLCSMARDMETACREGRREEAEQLGQGLSGLMRQTMAVYREHFDITDPTEP